MSFVTPHLFFILLLPLLVFAFVIIRHKQTTTQIFSEEVLKRLSSPNDGFSLLFRNILFLVALFLFMVALARPVIDHGEKSVQIEGLSAVVALDISGSMRAKDIYPNRLEFAKTKMLSLFEEMPTDELAVIAFAHSAFMLAPFSSDKATLKQIVTGVTDEYINMSSTDFTALGTYLSELLEEKKPKIVILFSDGGEKKELEAFEEKIQEAGIALYVVLVGTKQGSPVIDKDGKPLSHKGAIAITQRNDDLGTVALNNGGAFVIANSGTTDMKDLVTIIKSNHQSKHQGEVTIHDREELFYYPLAFGIFLLLIAFSSLPQRSKSANEHRD